MESVLVTCSHLDFPYCVYYTISYRNRRLVRFQTLVMNPAIKNHI